MELNEKTLESKVIYQGVIVTVKMDRVELINGRTAPREVVEHPGGVAILPLHSDQTVTLVQQYRYPFHRVITEVPAGKLEPGEDHRLCALRELEEEVGLVPEKLTDLGLLYLSPGYSNEILHLYQAQEFTERPCHPDEDEFLELARVPFQTLLDQAMAGTLTDAKTVAAVLKTKVLLGL